MGHIEEKFVEGISKGEIIKAICIKCVRETRHQVVTSFAKKGKEHCGGGYTIEWIDAYQVIQCQGCSELTFRKESSNSEDYIQVDDEEYEYDVHVTLYPSRTIFMRPAKDFNEVPIPLRTLYAQIIDAYNNDSFILATAGMRALVEGMCSQLKIIDGPVIGDNQQVERKKDLRGKIFGLHEKGYLTKGGANFLHEHRFMGNDAIHQLRKPSREELTIALDILEHCLDEVFVIPAKANELAQSRKKRNAKK